MTTNDLKNKISTIKAMKPMPAGRLASRLNDLQGKLAARNGIDMLALLMAAPAR